MTNVEAARLISSDYALDPSVKVSPLIGSVVTILAAIGTWLVASMNRDGMLLPK